jgi:hypothetical protein
MPAATQKLAKMVPERQLTAVVGGPVALTSTLSTSEAAVGPGLASSRLKKKMKIKMNE